MSSNEVFDLSTPEKRLERGVYDAAIDPFITDDIRSHVADYIARNPDVLTETSPSPDSPISEL